MLAAVDVLRRDLPALRIRVVNVNDLIANTYLEGSWTWPS